MVLSNRPEKNISSQESKENSFILWFEEVGIDDIPMVGGKNASLGEMIQQLTSKGVNVPTGFATTAHAYRYFIEKAGLESQLRELFAELDLDDVLDLRARGKKARNLVLNTPFPPELEAAISSAYLRLCERYNAVNGDCADLEGEAADECRNVNSDLDVAVRSSATAEDLPDAALPVSKKPISTSMAPKPC
jgi:pyruvate,water dikinase